MHSEHESGSTRRSFSGSALGRSLATTALVAIGVLVGNAASSGPPDKLEQTRLLLENPTPPAIPVSNYGFAIIGASDDRYYLVTPDGCAILVKDGRRDLCWR